jgi:hypothetical protein
MSSMMTNRMFGRSPGAASTSASDGIASAGVPNIPAIKSVLAKA